MPQSSSQIESAIKTFTEMESELDLIKGGANEAKKRLLALAREEAERSRREAIELVGKQVSGFLAKVKSEAEDEARKMIAVSDEEIKSLKSRIERVSDEAVKIVIKVIQGE